VNELEHHTIILRTLYQLFPPRESFPGAMESILRGNEFTTVHAVECLAEVDGLRRGWWCKPCLSG
jgi:hypothetical protein